MTKYNAFKIFFDGRSALDRELAEAARQWLKPWLEIGYPSMRQFCREIEAATGLDEARARTLIQDLGLQLSSKNAPPRQ